MADHVTYCLLTQTGNVAMSDHMHHNYQGLSDEWRPLS